METNILQFWTESDIKSGIIDFVSAVTNSDSPDFVKPEERIAVFDNDGTLWCEYPFFVQLYFIMDRFAHLLNQNPALAETQPYKAIAEKDVNTLLNFDKKQILEALFRAINEPGPDEYQSAVLGWFEEAKHPVLNRSFLEVAYKPQLELLHYLSQNDFKIFIVSGGGLDFMRVISDRLYGIPTHMTIGTKGNTELVTTGSVPVVTYLPGIRNFNDKDEKVLNINYHIGKRPIFAFGNSNGDQAMLRYTLAGNGRRISLLLHHDDAEREFAYDRDFKLSPLSVALDSAEADGIKVVSMKSDWKTVF